MNYPIHLNRELTLGTNDALFRVSLQTLLAHMNIGFCFTFLPFMQKNTATVWANYPTKYKSSQVSKEYKQ